MCSSISNTQVLERSVPQLGFSRQLKDEDNQKNKNKQNKNKNLGRGTGKLKAILRDLLISAPQYTLYSTKFLPFT